jgi:hypothetical protein
VASNTISFGKTNKRYPSLIHVVNKIRELRAVQWENKVDKEVSTHLGDGVVWTFDKVY